MVTKPHIKRWPMRTTDAYCWGVFRSPSSRSPVALSANLDALRVAWRPGGPLQPWRPPNSRRVVVKLNEQYHQPDDWVPPRHRRASW